MRGANRGLGFIDDVAKNVGKHADEATDVAKKVDMPPPVVTKKVSGHNPPLSSRQRLHTDGTPGKSQFNPDVDVEGAVRTAWEAGTPVFDKHGKFLGKRFTFNTPIGTSPTGHMQNSIFVHWSPNNGIHGVPATVGTIP